MATSVLVNDTIRIQVTFRDWESESYDIVDPDSVTVDILDASLVETPAVESPVKVEPGIYYYDWTPDTTGTFYVEFIGTFDSGTQNSVVREEFSVTSVPTNGSAGVNLGADYEFTFATSVSPLYADPEEFLAYYEDASMVEAMEHVYRFSKEVQTFLGLEDGEEPPPKAVEFVRFSTLCALSKVYDYGLMGTQSSITLGDLSVSSQGSPHRAINRATATDWCELAAVLRDEIIRSYGARMKTVVTGSKYRNPMPKRHLKHPTINSN